MTKRPSTSEAVNLMFQYKGLRDKTPELEEWKSYFEVYNADPANKQISMGCVPCYNKVYNYMLTKIKIGEFEPDTSL